MRKLLFICLSLWAVSIFAQPALQGTDKIGFKGTNTVFERTLSDVATYVKTPVNYTFTDGGTVAVNWNNGTTQTVTLGGNRTFTFSNPVAGMRYLLIVKQDGTGSRTVTWPTIKWRGGSPPTLTTTASKTDLITIIYDGTDYYADVSFNF